MTQLQAGEMAPDFKSTTQDGEPLTLADLRGQRTILYFYPKDMEKLLLKWTSKNWKMFAMTKTLILIQTTSMKKTLRNSVKQLPKN